MLPRPCVLRRLFLKPDYAECACTRKLENSVHFFEKFKLCLSQMSENKNVNSIFNFEIPISFIKEIEEINCIFGKKQLNTIHSTLMMIQEKRVEKIEKSTPQSSVINRTRHLKRVNVCLDYINNVKEFISADEIELELIANELRGIIINFDGILGLVDTERVLGEIFSNFCIGK